jgi:hypothetical protein
MLVIAEMVLSLKRFHNLLKDVECTDCTGGYGRKMFDLLFAVVRHGQLLVSSSVFQSLEVLTV